MACGFFRLHLRTDFGHFVLNIGMIFWQTANPREILPSGFVALFLGKPSRRFDHERHCDDEKTGGDELDGEGYTPLRRVRGHVLADAVVDPEAYQTA